MSDSTALRSSAHSFSSATRKSGRGRLQDRREQHSPQNLLLEEIVYQKRGKLKSISSKGSPPPECTLEGGLFIEATFESDSLTFRVSEQVALVSAQVEKCLRIFHTKFSSAEFGHTAMPVIYPTAWILAHVTETGLPFFCQPPLKYPHSQWGGNLGTEDLS